MRRATPAATGECAPWPTPSLCAGSFVLRPVPPLTSCGTVAYCLACAVEAGDVVRLSAHRTVPPPTTAQESAALRLRSASGRIPLTKLPGHEQRAHRRSIGRSSPPRTRRRADPPARPRPRPSAVPAHYCGLSVAGAGLSPVRRGQPGPSCRLVPPPPSARPAPGRATAGRSPAERGAARRLLGSTGRGPAVTSGRAAARGRAGPPPAGAGRWLRPSEAGRLHSRAEGPPPASCQAPCVRALAPATVPNQCRSGPSSSS